MNPVPDPQDQKEADAIVEAYKLGNKVTACKQLAMKPNRDTLYPLVEVQIEPAGEKKNFERLYKTFANRA